MNELSRLIKEDSRVKVGEHIIARKNKDPTHYERRKQQRAISEEMIALCLAYGSRKVIKGFTTYTILDKNIKGTVYSKYLSKLRGLRVVMRPIEEGKLGVTTVYWVDKLRRR